MRNLLLLMLLTCTLMISSCSEHDKTITESGNIVRIPDELLGEWKINIATYATDPNYNDGNGFGAYIKFNPDNTIEYKDGNNFGVITTFKSTVKQIKSGTDKITLVINRGAESITFKKSHNKPGQFEFKIEYPTVAPYTDMVLMGTKR
ncbi:hypothetical protein [Chryseobacterium sp.]|uniref:hypothetical protein n=1 Tax=Chryseobacterium sp. TaxID=1871047 RepID=UPI00260974B7|nr:hypothetical protein [Chryseobacterium sp.]